MFKFAEQGIVTWPVTLPVDTDGNIVDTVVKVRLRPLTRKELRAKISEAIAYWGDKGQDDIVEGLNAAYRAILP